MKTILILLAFVLGVICSGCTSGKMPRKDTLIWSAESKTDLISAIDTKIDSVVTLRVERRFEF